MSDDGLTCPVCGVALTTDAPEGLCPKCLWQEAFEAAPETAIPMAVLVQATNVSERSLRAGFRKYLGMSPTQYMRLRTLNRARQRLAASRADQASVAKVATDLGVWDLGRFAARYRQLFGELPSATLRR